MRTAGEKPRAYAKRNQQDRSAEALAHQRASRRTAPYPRREHQHQERQYISLKSEQAAHRRGGGLAQDAAQVGILTGRGGNQAQHAERGQRDQHDRRQFARDAALSRSERKFHRDGRRFELDWRFGLTRDGAQTSMMCGTISGRLPSAWLK